MVYSSLLGQTVELPMDSAGLEKKLNQLIAEFKVAEEGGGSGNDRFRQVPSIAEYRQGNLQPSTLNS